MRTPRLRITLCAGLGCALLAGVITLLPPGARDPAPSLRPPVMPAGASHPAPSLARTAVPPDIPRVADLSQLTEAELSRLTNLELWRLLLSQPPSRQRTENLRILLEYFATEDPQQACALALAVDDDLLQREALKAVLRGWASIDLDAAGAWAYSQTNLDYGQAFSSVFNGASNQNPQKLLRYAKEISRRDPLRTGDYGRYAIYALSLAGEFRTAAAFAADGGEAMRSEWIDSAYSKWGRRDPEEAVLSVTALSQSPFQRKAFEAALRGWAQTDSPGLAEFALAIPPGSERSLALVEALTSWAETDPDLTAAWMDHNDAAAELSERQLEQIFNN